MPLLTQSKVMNDIAEFENEWKKNEWRSNIWLNRLIQ